MRYFLRHASKLRGASELPFHHRLNKEIAAARDANQILAATRSEHAGRKGRPEKEGPVNTFGCFYDGIVEGRCGQGYPPQHGLSMYLGGLWMLSSNARAHWWSSCKSKQHLHAIMERLIPHRPTAAVCNYYRLLVAGPADNSTKLCSFCQCEPPTTLNATPKSVHKYIVTL